MPWWCPRSLDVDRRAGSGCRRGDRVSGRGHVEQGTHGSGHLGETSLLQNVQRKTQLTLETDNTEKETQEGTKENNKKMGQQMINKINE